MSILGEKLYLLKQLIRNQTIQIRHLSLENISILEKLDIENEKILKKLIYLDFKFSLKNNHKKIKRLLIQSEKKNQVVLKLYEKLSKKYQLELNFIEYKRQIGDIDGRRN